VTAAFSIPFASNPEGTVRAVEDARTFVIQRFLNRAPEFSQVPGNAFLGDRTRNATRGRFWTPVTLKDIGRANQVEGLTASIVQGAGADHTL
ncbi:hypothetical protein ABTL25_19430, partial [Acinetobacter baumannii]